MTQDSNDLKELKELTEENDNTDVGEENTHKYDTPDPTRDPYDYDDDPGVLKENARLWAKVGDTYFPADQTVNRLKAGQYSIEYSHNRGIYFSPKPINLDNLLILPDSASEEIIENIEHFWDKEQTFRDLGFLWKRGVLLYGPAGSGKTSTLQLIIKNVVERDGIAVYVKEPKLTASGLEMLRRIEPHRPVVVLVEDIDALQQSYGEADLLAMLDGDLQIDNVVFIATTNYPEKLDKRLVNRPSRFDIVRKIGMPTAEARAVYLTACNPRLLDDQDEFDLWVNETEDFSIAHIKELIVSVEALGQEFQATIDRLRVMMEKQPDSNDEGKSPVGFMGGAKTKKSRLTRPTRLSQEIEEGLANLSKNLEKD